VKTGKYTSKSAVNYFVDAAHIEEHPRTFFPGQTGNRIIEDAGRRPLRNGDV
jgi:hypothetical protein